MSRIHLLAIVAVALALTSALYIAYYSYFAPARVEIEELDEKFIYLYNNYPDFREKVDELRKMVLDPDTVFDGRKALALFNYILDRLGLPEMSPIYFRYGKSVREKAFTIPERISCSQPSFKFSLTILQPKLDVEYGNGLEAIYICSYKSEGTEVVEITLVFRDEDRPPANSSGDLWYDAWRLVSWGRVADIETFYILKRGERYVVEYRGLALILDETYGLRSIAPIGSSSKTYGDSGHFETSEISSTDSIVIYVNTWNHALSLRDNNPGIEKIAFTLDKVKVRIGARIDAENDYSMLKYISEIPRI